VAHAVNRAPVERISFYTFDKVLNITNIRAKRISEVGTTLAPSNYNIDIFVW
jgi:hypothetical protein